MTQNCLQRGSGGDRDHMKRVHVILVQELRDCDRSERTTGSTVGTRQLGRQRLERGGGGGVTPTDLHWQ